MRKTKIAASEEQKAVNAKKDEMIVSLRKIEDAILVLVDQRKHVKAMWEKLVPLGFDHNKLAIGQILSEGTVHEILTGSEASQIIHYGFATKYDEIDSKIAKLRTQYDEVIKSNF